MNEEEKMTSKNRKVVLIGGAGWPNYGDELIVSAWKKFLVGHNVADEIFFYEGNARIAKSLHGSKSRKNKIYFRDDIERLSQNVGGLDFWNQVIRGYRFIDKDGFNLYENIDFSAFKDASCVHLHGGGYLNDLWPQRGFYLGFVAALNKHYGIRIAATGIGLGPVNAIPKSLEKVIEEIFSRFHIFELRDVDSFRKLKKQFSSSNIVYGLDDCFLQGIDQFVKKDLEPKKKLFLSFIEYNVRKISDEFWKDLNSRSKDFDEVVFFESSPDQDRKVVEVIGDKLSVDRVQSVKDSLSSGVLMGENDKVLCSRFHVHYVCARFGVKGFYSQDSKYYDVKHQSIIDRGSDFLYSDFSSPIDEFPINKKSLMTLHEKSLVEQKRRVAEYIYM